jgi:hypothetical protein
MGYFRLSQAWCKITLWNATPAVEGKSQMSKELDQLVTYIEENADGYFLKGSLNNLEELLNQLFSGPEPLDLDAQRKLFIMSMSCFPLFSFTLRRDLNAIPEILRYSLLNNCVDAVTPKEISGLVSNFLEEVEEDWNENDEVGDHQLMNLVESVLRNPSLDLKTLAEEFHNTGDTGFISAILNNPICPEEFLQSIIDSDHMVFDKWGELKDLIEEAQSILSKRE